MCYFIQTQIDKGYAVKRVVVEASIAEQKEKAAAAEKAAQEANPAAYKALKAMKDAEKNAVDPRAVLDALKESAMELVSAIQNPKPAAKDPVPAVTPMEVDVKTTK